MTSAAARDFAQRRSTGAGHPVNPVHPVSSLAEAVAFFAGHLDIDGERSYGQADTLILPALTYTLSPSGGRSSY